MMLWKRIAVCLLVAGVLVAGVVVYFDEQPRTGPAQARFRARYDASIDRESLLASYSDLLRARNCKYIPAEVDAFLVSRLEGTSSSSEFEAIVHFYLRQGASRAGQHIGTVPDEVKTRVIDSIVRRMPILDGPDRVRAVEFVEYLRLDGDFYKPQLIGATVMTGPTTFRVVPEVVDEAASRYTRWWQSPAPWPEKKQIAPLAGSNLKFSTPQ